MPLPAFIVFLGGFAAGAFVLQSWQQTSSSRKKSGSGGANQALPARYPLPFKVLDLPTWATQAQFDELDAFLCQCSEEVVLENPEVSEAALPELIRDCVAAQMYPDVPWPPVLGDHPSIWSTWDMLLLRIREMQAEGTLATICQGMLGAQPPALTPSTSPPPSVSVDPSTEASVFRATPFQNPGMPARALRKRK